MKYTQISDALPPVSRLSLGSWNTFSRISFEDNISLVRRALDLGVNLFDVGYYWDKPHTEVIFGRVIQVIGAPRSEYLLAEKLWLWDYPKQSFVDQLKASLLRLGEDTIDIIMVSRPLEGMDVVAMAEEVVALLGEGLGRAWGVTNWEPEQVRAVQAAFTARGLPLPAIVQMQYNPSRRDVVERSDYAALFAETGIRLCAAHTLEGGILGGHLDRERVHPSQFEKGVVPNERNIARDSGGIREEIRARQPELARIAAEFGLTPAQAAIAFTQAHPGLATTLVGVTRISDLEDNVRAVAFSQNEALKTALAPVAVAGAAHPRLFSPTQENA